LKKLNKKTPKLLNNQKVATVNQSNHNAEKDTVTALKLAFLAQDTASAQILVKMVKAIIKEFNNRLNNHSRNLKSIISTKHLEKIEDKATII